jgi:hypothetical protein
MPNAGSPTPVVNLLPERRPDRGDCFAHCVDMSLRAADSELGRVRVKHGGADDQERRGQ